MQSLLLKAFQLRATHGFARRTLLFAQLLSKGTPIIL
jgi:hypothetical protein